MEIDLGHITIYKYLVRCRKCGVESTIASYNYMPLRCQCSGCRSFSIDFLEPLVEG